MPRDGSNIYSKPAGTTAVTSTTIVSAKYNQTIDDLVTDANTPRPVVAGGTGASSASAARTNLGLAIGTNVQAYDATLTSIAALGTAADKGIYSTGVDTWAEFSLTSAGRALIDDADASAQRTTLGLAIGTDVAAIASPTFTGTPAAPTATAGTNTTQIATTAFVTAAVAAIPAPAVKQWESWETTFDYSTHGASATRTSGDFEDGYEYMFIFEALLSSAGSGANLQIALYRDTSATYTSFTDLSDATAAAADDIWGYAELLLSRISNGQKLVRYNTRVDPNLAVDTEGVVNLTASNKDAGVALFSFATDQKVRRVRFQMDSGNLNGGRIYGLRRAL